MKYKAIAMVRVRRDVREDLLAALPWALWGSLVGFALGLANRLMGF